MPPPPKSKTKNKNAGSGLRIFLTISLLCTGLGAAYVWWRFHPGQATAVIGPAGQANWAYIESSPFGDPGYVLRVSDWPHTFVEPASLGEVEGSKARAFWSNDGSVLTVRSDDKYTAAYDFTDHRALHHWVDIETLVSSRGGLGPEQLSYPGTKDDKDKKGS